MGEVEWANTDKSELEITCNTCETKWKSPVKVINGKTVDVKTSLMKEGWKISDLHLLAHKVSHPTELYIRILISHDKRKAFICGWTTRKYLLDNAEDWEYNNHMLYRLPNSKLSDIILLKEEQSLTLGDWV